MCPCVSTMGVVCVVRVRVCVGVNVSMYVSDVGGCGGSRCAYLLHTIYRFPILPILSVHTAVLKAHNESPVLRKPL